jgi:hypothetical protein
MQLVEKKIEDLRRSRYNPKCRTAPKAVESLKRSIERHGILQPILITREGVIIDGHRRVECLKRLNRTSVPAIVSDGLSTLTPQEKFEQTNTTQRKLANKEMLYVYMHGGVVPPEATKKIVKMEALVGRERLNDWADRWVSWTVMQWVRMVCRYCREESPAFERMALTWLVEKNQSYNMRKAIESGISPKRLREAITNGRPLKVRYA